MIPNNMLFLLNSMTKLIIFVWALLQVCHFKRKSVQRIFIKH